jgi:zinc-binding alcohol dehydrogenase/oxidoreductase
LSWEEAAAIPLAGLTAWRALMTRGACQSGNRVLITGIGSGVALFALQFAVAAGAEVWVTSSSEAKIARAMALGARGGFLYTQQGWATQAAKSPGAFDLIIESAGGDGFNDLIDICAPGGRIVFFGATRGNPGTVALRKIFWRQISLLGTTMGSPPDWWAMTEFLAQHRIRPVISEVFSFADAGQAFALMETGSQFGKIVLRIHA